MPENRKPLKRIKIGDEVVIAFGGKPDKNAKIVIKEANEDKHTTMMFIPDGDGGEAKFRFDVHEKREKPTVEYKSLDFGEVDAKRFNEKVMTDIIGTMTQIDLGSDEWKNRDALVPDDLSKAFHGRDLELPVNDEGPFKRTKVCQLKDVEFAIALVEIGGQFHGILKKEGAYYHLDLARLEPILNQFLLSESPECSQAPHGAREHVSGPPEFSAEQAPAV